MRRTFRLTLGCCLSLLPTLLPAANLQETWESGYEKTDATGPHVRGYWKFDAADPLADSSGKGHRLTLHGAQAASAGRFGAALESFPGFPIQDQRHAAVTTPKPALSPKGAFTLEMWIKPKPDWPATQRAYLLDKKYVDHTDYAWQVSEADKAGLRRFFVTLGFGSESKAIYSQPIKLTPDWQHLAFVYDGGGEGTFFRNGEHVGGARLAGSAAVSPGAKPLSLGDRLGSNYGGFPGWIDEVRICDGALKFERAELRITAPRQVWRRLETSRPIDLVITNLQRQPLQGAKLHTSLGGRSETFALPNLLPGQSHTLKHPLNTALKAGDYELRARFESGNYSTEQAAHFQIVPRQPPRMPVIMWGASGEEIPRLKDLGFTHFIGFSAQELGTIWKAGKPQPPGSPEYIARNRGYLDQALAHGLEVIASLSPRDFLAADPKNLRVDRAGKPYERKDIVASRPEFAAFFRNIGASIGQAYGDHPAFTTALINTEVRDASQPSFTAEEIAAHRQSAGTDIPAEVTGRWATDWTKLKDFPADRVVADDQPLLNYFRWFWTVGDGWNSLHSALHQGVKSSAGRVWTFFDPAVRQPSISGAGGSVDVLSHWTYTYPDPQRIGLCADQLLAMSAASGRNQRVMKMTQLIWYRSQTAPTGGKPPGEVVAWEDHDPDAAYITIAPMHLKEALWTKIARPVQGIMYHGWQSLVPTDSPSAYRFTHAGTAPVLRQLVREVIEPLGPTLLKIPDERSEVALLESFTSQVFARRGGYGWNNGWPADVWLALQHAHVQTDILYEETLLKNGLSGRKVLLMPHCDVLPRSVVSKIVEWQRKGGRIIADEFLCPGLKADITLPSFQRQKKAAEDKTRVLALAQTLHDLGLPQKIACDNPELITRVRKAGDATYVFVINDRREYGSYVGQHGLVMENGLPASGTLSLPTDNAHIYDLTSSRLVVPGRDPTGAVRWKVDLGPGDGKIFLVLPKPLLRMELELPETATTGQQAVARVRLNTTAGATTPLKAVIPLHVEVRDANGVVTEGTGHYAAENGFFELPMDLAPNEDPGTWEVRVQELASGMEEVRWMRVSAP